MLVGRKFNWSHRPSGCTSRDKQIYYEVFHANKNHFVGSLHLPLIDAYQCLKLSDNFSRELGSSHSLGNLNVKQSKQCIENMRDNGHIRENHSDSTGGPGIARDYFQRSVNSPSALREFRRHSLPLGPWLFTVHPRQRRHMQRRHSA